MLDILHTPVKVPKNNNGGKMESLYNVPSCEEPFSCTGWEISTYFPDKSFGHQMCLDDKNDFREKGHLQLV